MVFTKERTIAKNTQAPTSVYLNSETVTDAVSLSMSFNEQLLSNRTNPHLNRSWTICYNNRFNLFFATPDNILSFTGIPQYFRQLLKYQNGAGLIEPNDVVSTYKYRRLYSKYIAVIANHSKSLPDEQRKAFIEVLKKIAANPNVSLNDLNIEINADDELALIRKEDDGMHYILVGDNSNDISYLFVSDIPGFYSSLHLTEEATLKNILDSFTA
jgi:hypothetical protein